MRRGRWQGVVAALVLAVIGAVVAVAPARGVDGWDVVDGEEFVAQPPFPQQDDGTLVIGMIQGTRIENVSRNRFRRGRTIKERQCHRHLSALA